MSQGNNGPRDGPMSNNEFGKMVSHLVRLTNMTPGQIGSIIGNNPNGRTRGEVANELKLWISGRSEA